jgi:hypothetical protein
MTLGHVLKCNYDLAYDALRTRAEATTIKKGGRLRINADDVTAARGGGEEGERRQGRSEARPAV